MRLMREHVGVDVDAMIDSEPTPQEEIEPDHEQEWDLELEQERGDRNVTQAKHMASMSNILHTAGKDIEQSSCSPQSRRLKRLNFD